MESTSTPSSPPSTRHNPSRKNNLCQECKVAEFCYQCPGCGFRSCSLTCCRAHKERLQCNGRRDRTTFLRLGQMSDHTLTSDFHFLEDMIRNVDAGKRVLKRTRAGGGGGGGGGGGSGSDFHNNHGNKRPRRTTPGLDQDENEVALATPSHPLLHASRTYMQPVVSAAPRQHNTNWSHVSPRWRHVAKFALEQRSTKILFMPNGMQRRLQNTTHLKKDVIHWTVEWIFHHPMSTGSTAQKKEKTTTTTSASMQTPTTTVQLITLPESTQLLQAMEHPQLLQQQRKVATNDAATASLVTENSVKLLIKQIPHKTYTVLSSSATLRDILKERTVIEFPTIEVVPVERLNEFHISLQEVVLEERPPVSDDAAQMEKIV